VCVCRVCVCVLHELTPLGRPMWLMSTTALAPFPRQYSIVGIAPTIRWNAPSAMGRVGGWVSEGVGNDGWRMRGMFGALQTSTRC
jgi:hypothetical protein